MDDIDLTERRNEILTRANCYQSRKPEPQGKANGHCWHCTKPVEPGRRWCNAACRDQWQTKQPKETTRGQQKTKN